MPTITCTLPTHEYCIHVEPGALGRLGAIAAGVAPHARAVMAVDDAIVATHGVDARNALAGSGYDVLEHALVADEKAKTIDTVRGLCAAMLAGRIERATPMVAVGGGVVGDVAGFAASIYLRGIPLVQAPTTLLAMVDASIGGKTGVNFPLPDGGSGARLGKNLVGAFWQPRAVVADPLVLRTLDPRDFRCGLAECVKHGVIADPDLLAFLERRAEDLAALDAEALTTLIDRSARIKVSFVVEDERESGRRALLNLGHTFAHVIEPIADLDLRHGEAVAIGLCAAARCAVETGRLGAADAERIVSLLTTLGLPTELPRPEAIAGLVTAMGYDKKVRGGALRLVLPTALGRAEIVDDVPPDAVRRAWEAVGAARRGAG